MEKSKESPTFLNIPQEVRDIIYNAYVVVEGGYEYDFESGKLVCAIPAGARRPIDLALMLSCRQVAREMKGLALEKNTITFRTCSPDSKRANLAYFQTLMRHFWSKTFQCLREFDYSHETSNPEEWSVVANFDAEVYQTIAQRFPQFEPHLRTIQLWEADPSLNDRFDLDIEVINEKGRLIDKLDYVNDACWGEVPSLHRQAALETLKLISARGCWSEKAWEFDRIYDLWSDEIIQMLADSQILTPDRAPGLLAYHSNYKPWSIPDDDVINDMSTGIGSRAFARQTGFVEHYPGDDDWQLNIQHRIDFVRHYLSAASLAIRFLDSILAQRKHIRNIVLEEDHGCIAFPECHGLGLIPFCKENPGLHIERRANLWRSVWQSRPECTLPKVDWWEGELREFVTERVACWTVEALALVPAGMPVGSFSLVFDGDPAPERCAEIFQEVQRDAAWQTALEESFDRGFLPALGYHEKRRFNGYLYEGFPQALRDISSGSCRVIRCNFDVGEPWDVEALIEARREWGPEEWHENWRNRLGDMEPPGYDDWWQTAPPLPSWDDLLLENSRRSESGKISNESIMAYYP